MIGRLIIRLVGIRLLRFRLLMRLQLFARNLNDGDAAPEELTGARLNRVLDQVRVNWPALQRDIDDGNSTLEAGVLLMTTR
jgi:hypothetical protein